MTFELRFAGILKLVCFLLTLVHIVFSGKASDGQALATNTTGTGTGTGTRSIHRNHQVFAKAVWREKLIGFETDVSQKAAYLSTKYAHWLDVTSWLDVKPIAIQTSGRLGIPVAFRLVLYKERATPATPAILEDLLHVHMSPSVSPTFSTNKDSDNQDSIKCLWEGLYFYLHVLRINYASSTVEMPLLWNERLSASSHFQAISLPNEMASLNTLSNRLSQFLSGTSFVEATDTIKSDILRINTLIDRLAQSKESKRVALIAQRNAVVRNALEYLQDLKITMNLVQLLYSDTCLATVSKRFFQLRYPNHSNSLALGKQLSQLIEAMQSVVYRETHGCNGAKGSASSNHTCILAAAEELYLLFTTHLESLCNDVNRTSLKDHLLLKQYTRTDHASDAEYLSAFTLGTRDWSLCDVINLSSITGSNHQMSTIRVTALYYYVKYTMLELYHMESVKHFSSCEAHYFYQQQIQNAAASNSSFDLLYDELQVWSQNIFSNSKELSADQLYTTVRTKLEAAFVPRSASWTNTAYRSSQVSVAALIPITALDVLNSSFSDLSSDYNSSEEPKSVLQLYIPTVSSHVATEGQQSYNLGHVDIAYGSSSDGSNSMQPTVSVALNCSAQGLANAFPLVGLEAEPSTVSPQRMRTSLPSLPVGCQPIHGQHLPSDVSLMATTMTSVANIDSRNRVSSDVETTISCSCMAFNNLHQYLLWLQIVRLHANHGDIDFHQLPEPCPSVMLVGLTRGSAGLHGFLREKYPCVSVLTVERSAEVVAVARKVAGADTFICRYASLATYFSHLHSQGLDDILARVVYDDLNLGGDDDFRNVCRSTVLVGDSVHFLSDLSDIVDVINSEILRLASEIDLDEDDLTKSCDNKGGVASDSTCLDRNLGYRMRSLQYVVWLLSFDLVLLDELDGDNAESDSESKSESLFAVLERLLRPRNGLAVFCCSLGNAYDVLKHNLTAKYGSRSLIEFEDDAASVGLLIANPSAIEFDSDADSGSDRDAGPFARSQWFRDSNPCDDPAAFSEWMVAYGTEHDFGPESKRNVFNLKCA